MQQRVDARIGKAQARGPLAAGRDRAVDALKGIFRQDAIMTDMLDIEQAAVGRKTDFAQLRQIKQTPADAEIVAVIDGGFGAQGAVFLVVLLDPGVFVLDVQGRCYVLGQDAGPKPSRCLAVDLAIEDQLDFLRATEIEVLADHLFEEQAAVQRSIEHLGQ